MNIFKRALYVSRPVLLFIVAKAITVASLYGLTTTPAHENRFNLWLMLFISIGLHVVAARLWCQLRAREAESTDQLVRLTEQLRRRGITEVAMVHDGSKEKVTIQRESTVLGFDYTVTVTTTEQHFTDGLNAEIVETLVFTFGKQQQRIGRTVTYVNIPEPHTKVALQHEEHPDATIEIPGRKKLEEAFQYASATDIKALVDCLTRAAEWSGIALDG